MQLAAYQLHFSYAVYDLELHYFRQLAMQFPAFSSYAGSSLEKPYIALY
jgi:hypothetical protein